jgi:hypothetical protein
VNLKIFQHFTDYDPPPLSSLLLAPGCQIPVLANNLKFNFKKPIFVCFYFRIPLFRKNGIVNNIQIRSKDDRIDVAGQIQGFDPHQELLNFNATDQ